MQSKPERAQLQPEADGFGFRVAVAPHPGYLDVHPSVSRVFTREQLELTSHLGPTFLIFGDLRSIDRDRRQIFAALEDLDLLNRCRIIIAGWTSTMGVEEQFRELASRHRTVQLSLGSIASHRIQIYFWASDVVMMPMDRRFTWTEREFAMSMGRPVLTPANSTMKESISEGNFRYDASGLSIEAGFRDAVERASKGSDDWEAVGKGTPGHSRVGRWEDAANAVCRPG